jgi:TolB-like protein
MPVSATSSGNMKKTSDGAVKRKGPRYRYRLLFILFCSILLTLCFSLFTPSEAVPPSQKIRIALLPFENLTDDKTAFDQIMPVVKNMMESKGFELVNGESLNNFLCKERVRSTGYISMDIAQKIKKEFNVDAILLGSITSYYPLKNPQVGLLARSMDPADGVILWANQASATGEDFTTILGLGTIKSMEKLITEVVDRLLDSFSVTPVYKEKEQTHRVAVMPFQNKSGRQDAGMVVTYMFLSDLLQQKGFEPVDYGDVRRLVVDLRVRSRGELDYKNIKSFSDDLNVDGIVVGTVEQYSDGLDTSSPPVVAISARLINARKDRVLWSDSIQVNGDQDIIILDWGRIRAVDSVAYEAVTELIGKMEEAKWQ